VCFLKSDREQLVAAVNPETYLAQYVSGSLAVVVTVVCC
jgi:hypothetical protein